jgi:hypothetical protein
MIRPPAAPSTEQLALLDDAGLLDLVRAGCSRARETLRARHAYMARRMARHLRLGDQIALSAIDDTVDGGTDPSRDFRLTLFTAIRRRATSRDVTPVPALCRTVRASLGGLLERTLPMAEQRRVHEHLHSCPACVAFHVAVAPPAAPAP